MVSKQRKEIILVFILAIVSYSPSIPADFTFDDRPAILENKDVTEVLNLKNISEHLQRILRHDFWGSSIIDHSTSHKSYRPFTVFTFALDNLIEQQTFQDLKCNLTYPCSPILFHLNNVVIHVLNTVLF